MCKTETDKTGQIRIICLCTLRNAAALGLIWLTSLVASCVFEEGRSSEAAAGGQNMRKLLGQDSNLQPSG
jgi:hypothetical protein